MSFVPDGMEFDDEWRYALLLFCDVRVLIPKQRRGYSIRPDIRLPGPRFHNRRTYCNGAVVLDYNIYNP